MPRKCVLFGCNNSFKTGHTVHKFPKDPQLRRAWTRFVQVRRANFVMPNENSDAAICELHFSEECYNTVRMSIMAEMGSVNKGRLFIDGSVPTIQPQSKRQLGMSETNIPRKRRAAGKLEVARILNERVENMEPDEIRVCELEKIEQQRFVSVGVQTDVMVRCNKSCQTTKNMFGIKTRSQGINTVGTVTVGTEISHTEISQPDQEKPLTSTPLNSVPPSLLSPITQEIEPSDSEYKPSDLSMQEANSMSEQDKDDNSQRNKTLSPCDESKYIVFEQNLLELFQQCPICTGPSEVSIVKSFGTMIRVLQSCANCSHKRTWDSQPIQHQTPLGNLLLSAAVLISGSQITQTLRLLDIMGIKACSRTTLNRPQTNYVIPNIIKYWEKERGALIEELRSNTGLHIAGDCRSDSPGHSAKYGSYTLIEQSTKKVLDIQLVQSNEAGNSNACELVGFKRSVSALTETEGLKLATLVTDRHPGIAAHVQDWLIPNNTNCADVKHYNDVWHTSKGLAKKIDKIGQKHKEVSLWKKSILNHMHYVAEAAPRENRKQHIHDMWLSLDNHIHDVHEHQLETVKTCEHQEINYVRDKKWLVRGSEGSTKISDLLTSERVLKDVGNLSPEFQTSALEAFHSRLLKFAPKHTHFSWLGMTARLYVAGLHHNENSQRLQAVGKDDEILQYRIRFPKNKGGEYSLKPVRTSPTHEYAHQLMRDMVKSHNANPTKLKNCIRELKQEQPAPLCADMIHPSKQDAINLHQSRFKV